MLHAYLTFLYKTYSLKLGLVYQLVSNRYLQMSIYTTSTYYSRTFIKFTAIEIKSTITAKTTNRITQIKKLSLFIDTAHITTNKEVHQYNFLFCLIYTITG